MELTFKIFLNGSIYGQWVIFYLLNRKDIKNSEISNVGRHTLDLGKIKV